MTPKSMSNLSPGSPDNSKYFIDNFSLHMIWWKYVFIWNLQWTFVMNSSLLLELILIFSPLELSDPKDVLRTKVPNFLVLQLQTKVASFHWWGHDFTSLFRTKATNSPEKGPRFSGKSIIVKEPSSPTRFFLTCGFQRSVITLSNNLERGVKVILENDSHFSKIGFSYLSGQFRRI